MIAAASRATGIAEVWGINCTYYLWLLKKSLAILREGAARVGPSEPPDSECCGSPATARSSVT
jgi:hypothetical protein